MRNAPMLEVAINTKNAPHPATPIKLRRLIRQIPGSSTGGLSCLGFLIAEGAAATGGFAAVGVTGVAGSGGAAATVAGGTAVGIAAGALGLGAGFGAAAAFCSVATVGEGGVPPVGWGLVGFASFVDPC